MSNILSDLSIQLATAIDRASAAVVQVHGHRRPAAGVVFADDLIVAPARALGDDTAVVRLATGATAEGHVLGHALSMGLAVVRVPGLGVAPAEVGDEPRVGHLAIAIGRTWSGGVMATVTNVAVVGGPLRTSRASEIERVIRIAQAPHGALTGGALANGDGQIVGVITNSAIRGTTVVLPATLVWAAAHQIVKHGGTRQGFLGISSTTVVLPERQRGNHKQAHGLLVTAIVGKSPVEEAGLLVGDVIMAFEGQPVEEPEALLTLLRGDHVGTAVVLSVLRGLELREMSVTVGERPKRRG